jgi:hypothetical protein
MRKVISEVSPQDIAKRRAECSSKVRITGKGSLVSIQIMVVK